MLTYLRIRNFGIFQDVSLELGPGLTVFTGETGAGKSMIVDAVMAGLGYRTSSDVIRSGENRASLDLLIFYDQSSFKDMEGIRSILDDGPEIAVQRDILPERSYIRVNGRIATMSTVQSIGSRLVDIHGQQDHHSLLRPQVYLSIIDGLNKDLIDPIRTEYCRAYSRRLEVLAEMQNLRRDKSQRSREIDLLSYQITEIDNAELKPGEEGSLRQEHRVLQSLRKLIGIAQEALNLLYHDEGNAAYVHLTKSISLLEHASSIDPKAAEAGQALEQVLFCLEVALDLLRDYERNLSLDPSNLELIEARLDLIEKLKTKYGNSIERIIEFGNAAKTRLDRLLRADEILSGFEKELAKTGKDMVLLGEKLTAIRRETALNMEKSITRTLEELNMPGARFNVVFEYQEDLEDGVEVAGRRIRPFADGFDKVGFDFSANPGEPPLPLNRVASGGELSRLMLAIKSCMGEVDAVPTLIFDEIDAGVGGKAGQAIGEKLWQLGRNHQVLCVTHLASIASMADTHYVVAKAGKEGRTFARVQSITGDDKAKEIARMLSGSDLGVSLQHGKQLIASARAFKESF